MKEVFKCDYCNYIGTKEEIEEHEKVCLNNPDVKCCYNCQYAYENPYIGSVGFRNPGPSYTCMYKPYTEYKPNVLYTGEPIPEKNICEHYERGTPHKVVGL